MADKIYSTVAVPTGTLFMHIHVHCINLHVYDFINWCFVGDTVHCLCIYMYIVLICMYMILLTGALSETFGRI